MKIALKWLCTAAVALWVLTVGAQQMEIKIGRAHV